MLNGITDEDEMRVDEDFFSLLLLAFSIVDDDVVVVVVVSMVCSVVVSIRLIDADLVDEIDDILTIIRLRNCCVLLSFIGLKVVIALENPKPPVVGASIFDSMLEARAA